MTDTIELEDAGASGRYVLRSEGQVAEMRFSRTSDGTIRINHTGVPDALSGRGLGAQLVARAVADAKAAGVKVQPVCSYAAAQFDKHPEWADLRSD